MAWSKNGGEWADDMRFEALQFLSEESAIDTGPHRFFSSGKWQDVQLLAAEIVNEAMPSDSPPHVIRQFKESGFMGDSRLWGQEMVVGSWGW
ncbi:hypothetical protein [Stieleria maiorica]|nr:hypothetical protein [Stieleria maiorica]